MNRQTRPLILIALLFLPASVGCDDESSASSPDTAVQIGDQHDAAMNNGGDAQVVDAALSSADTLSPPMDTGSVDAPTPKTFDIDFSWGTGSPFLGKTQTPCGEIELVSTETEPWTELYFRDNTGGPAATVRFGLTGTFTRLSIMIERVNVDESLTTFSPLPDTVDTDLTLADGRVTTARGDDFGSGRLHWRNPPTTVGFTIDAPVGALALTRISGECPP